MSFDNPTALWLLTLAVPVVLAHLYRGRLRPILVPTLHFWDQILQEEERKSALRRLRHYISLLLHLLILLLLTSILAGPRVRGITHVPDRVAFVLDTTLSMAAAGRMEEARDRIRRSLDSLYRDDKVALHDSAGLLVPFTRDRDRILTALNRPPRWTRRPGDVAGAILRAHPDARVEIVTDRGPRPNAAITGVRRLGNHAVVRLEGFGIEGPTTLQIHADGKPHSQHAAEIPGEARLELPDADLVRISLPGTDDCPIDDSAFLVLPARAPPRTLLLTDSEENPFLLVGLKLLADEGTVQPVRVAPLAEYDAIRESIDESTIVFTNGGELPALGRGIYVCFGTSSPAWITGEPVESASIVDWDREHPALRGIDPASMAIREARRLSGGRELLRTADGAVGITGGGSGRAWIAMGFPLEASDLGLRTVFPLLLRNLVRWTASGASRLFPLRIDSGSALVNRHPLDPPEGLATIEWTDGLSSSRRNVPYRGGKLREVLILPGLYRIRVGPHEEWTAVPHAPPEEANLTSAPPPREPPPPLRGYQDLPWAWVAGTILLALLLSEWIFYQRGWI